MRDWINDMLYKSWCQVTLKNMIEREVKGHVSVTTVNDDALIEVLSQDYSMVYYAQVVYDFGTKVENHEIMDLDLVNISGNIVNRFKTKILKKYFK